MAKNDKEPPINFFGSKVKIAPAIWERLGRVDYYVEPFFGSGAVMLASPYVPEYETVNDCNGFIVNFYRSIKYNPIETAKYSQNPVFETDLHAKHIWLLSQKEKLVEQLEANPAYCNPMIAGWWCWVMSVYVGADVCSGTGPWKLVDGKLQKSDTENPGIYKKMPDIRSYHGVNRPGIDVYRWFETLSKRFSKTRVLCGDWTRLKSHIEGAQAEMMGVVLDPPYDNFEYVYSDGNKSVSGKVREWALEVGKRKNIRVALCGYEGEHEMPSDWEVFSWKQIGGYSLMGKEDSEGRENRDKERIYFSPYCQKGKQFSVFDLIKKKKEAQEFSKLKQEQE